MHSYSYLPPIAFLPGSTVYPRHIPREFLAETRWAPIKPNRQGKFRAMHWLDDVVEEDCLEDVLTTADRAITIAENLKCQLGYLNRSTMRRSGLIRITLVDAFDRDNGSLRPWARPIEEMLVTNTYWQRREKGRVIDFLLRGQIELEHDRYLFESSTARIEVHQGQHFIPMTGENDFTVPIRDCQAQLDNLKRYLMSNPCLLCARPWCLGHEPHDRIRGRVGSETQRINSLMKRVACELNKIQPEFGASLFSDSIWREAIATTAGTGLSVEMRVLLLGSWSQRQGIPQPETSIPDLVEAFDRKAQRKANRTGSQFS